MKSTTSPPSPRIPYAHPRAHRPSKRLVLYSHVASGVEFPDGLLAEALGASDGRGPALALLAHGPTGRMLAALDATVTVPRGYRQETDELRAHLERCYERAEALRR